MFEKEKKNKQTKITPHMAVHVVLNLLREHPAGINSILERVGAYFHLYAVVHARSHDEVVAKSNRRMTVVKCNSPYPLDGVRLALNRIPHTDCIVCILSAPYRGWLPKKMYDILLTRHERLAAMTSSATNGWIAFRRNLLPASIGIHFVHYQTPNAPLEVLLRTYFKTSNITVKMCGKHGMFEATESTTQRRRPEQHAKSAIVSAMLDIRKLTDNKSHKPVITNPFATTNMVSDNPFDMLY